MIGTLLFGSIVAILNAFAAAEYDVGKYCQLITPGTKLPSLKSCQTYYICQGNGEPIQANCSDSNVFSKYTQTCVPAADSTCYYDLSNPCKFKEEGFAPSDEGCNMWNYCLKGQIVATASCPAGQIFDSLSSSCINGSCRNDDGNNNSDVKNVCEIMPDDVFFGDFINCNDWFKCSGLSVKSGSCRNDLVFDTKTGMCLDNDGTICQRTNNTVVNRASGPPSENCNNVNQIVGDTNVCSIYYTCQRSSQSPAATYKWVDNNCNNKYYDVISKQCRSTSLARSYPGCDRCQFTTGNPYWVNVVDPTCSQYATCNNGKQVGVSPGSCGVGNFFNQGAQACILKGDESQYEISNGACQDYSCTDDRICTLSGENGGSDNGSGGDANDVDGDNTAGDNTGENGDQNNSGEKGGEDNSGAKDNNTKP